MIREKSAFDCYQKLVEVSKAHPNLFADIDYLLEKGKTLTFVRWSVNEELTRLGRPNFDIEELKGFLQYREQLQKKEEQLRKRKKGKPKAAKGNVTTGRGAQSPSPGEDTAGTREVSRAWDKKSSALSPAEELQRDREPKRTHAEIVEWAADKVREVFEVARNDPNSDAATVMKVLTFNQIVANEEKLHEEAMTKVMDAFRRSEQLEREKAHLQREEGYWKDQTRLLQAKARNLELVNKALANKLKGVTDVIKQKTMLTTADIYNKISAVIGIGDTVVPRIEQGIGDRG